MIAAESSAIAVRFPPRLQMVSVQTEPQPALDALLSADTIDDRQHAAAVVYRTLRRRFKSATRSYRHRPDRASMPETAFLALKRDHAALLRFVGTDRWPLDRLCLDDDAPLACEVERVRAALERMAEMASAAP